MDNLRSKVKKRYGQAIRKERGCGSGDGCAPFFLSAERLYGPSFLEGVPSSLAEQTFGCGNPLKDADLKPGETVLDLGCGAGLDLLLASEAVGADGHVIGIDMTEEMLRAAEKNLKGIGNETLLRGYLEDLPLEEESVDVVISNCVINLSPDKGKVLREAWRVLRPGGRFSVADTVFLKPVPSEILNFLVGWCGCISGALSVEDYERFLSAAGFVSIEVRPKKVFFASEVLLEMMFPDLPEADRMKLKGALASVAVTAVKPLA